MVILLAVQACQGALLGGLWFALLLGEAEVQGYGTVDYLAPVVVLGVGVALGVCVFLVKRDDSSVLALVSATQVLAMLLGAYTPVPGCYGGHPPS